MTQSALGEVTNIVGKTGGPLEQARLAELLKRVTVIPDGVSSGFSGARVTGNIGANDIQIFGTGDARGLMTLTTDAKGLRALQAQGINVKAIRFDPVPLTGK